MLRRVDRASVEPKLAVHASVAADRMLAEDHAVLRWLDSENAQIE